MALDVDAELFESGAARVAVDHHPVAGRAAEQLVDRESGDLAIEIPQGHVDGADRGHRHRTAAPVGALVEVLPGVLDPAGIPADQQRAQMITQV